MLKTVEIRQTFNNYLRAETLVRYSADDVRIKMSGEELIIFVTGHVTEEGAE